MTHGIILAAGRSSRMGRPKALLTDTSPQTFVARLIDAMRAAGLARVVVISRPDDAALAAEAQHHGAVVVQNPAADEGQLSSLLVGLMSAADADAVLVSPVDMPLISSDVMRRLLASAAASPALIVRAVHRGRHGHPVIFKRDVFDELRRADPSEGARAVVRRDLSRVLDVEVEDAGVTLDLDTPDDYQRAFGRKL